MDLILDLQPDLVIANLEENEAQDVMALEIAGVPCWVCDVRTVERAFRLLGDLGELVGAGECGPCPGAGGPVRVGSGSSGRPRRRGSSSGLCSLAQSLDVGRARCLIQSVRWWGWSTWPDAPRYPECDMEAVLESGVEEVLLPSEPFPFKEAHRAECLGLTSTLVDGEMFSWYGSRMLQVPAYIASGWSAG